MTLLAAAAPAQAQVAGPVKILVGFAPGGSAEVAARLIGEKMAAELKQPAVVEKKPGAGGRIAAEQLKNAPADGTTIMLAPIVVPVLADRASGQVSARVGRVSARTWPARSGASRRAWAGAARPVA